MRFGTSTGSEIHPRRIRHARALQCLSKEEFQCRKEGTRRKAEHFSVPANNVIFFETLVVPHALNPERAIPLSRLALTTLTRTWTEQIDANLAQCYSPNGSARMETLRRSEEIVRIVVRHTHLCALNRSPASPQSVSEMMQSTGLLNTLKSYNVSIQSYPYRHLNDVKSEHLEAWKRKLAVSLNHDLSHMQNKLDASIRFLSEEFEKNCQDLDSAEQVLTSTLAQETVSVVRDGGEPVQINLGQHVQEFRNVYKEKSQQLREYWKQYEQVQTEIERFVIEVIGHAAFEASATDEESDKPATSTKLEQVYDSAREQYAARKTELQIFTNQALEDNKKIFEVSYLCWKFTRFNTY